MVDNLKLGLSLLLLGSGIAGFYALDDQAMVLRVLAVLGGVAAAVAVAWFTAPGQQFFVFAQEATSESRKVVWPSRKETVQTTAMIFAFAVVMAILLWLADKGLEWVLYDLVLGWRK
ncbi:MAG TPA: preprotein translocase subunit SecE [Rhodocyclaceae bacterium]